jgi:hypothetical protein
VDIYCSDLYCGERLPPDSEANVLKLRFWISGIISLITGKLIQLIAGKIIQLITRTF